MNLRTIGLALLASAFMTSAALAQSGTMQPIPNPPETHKMTAKHKHKHQAKKPDADAKADAKEGKDAAKK